MCILGWLLALAAVAHGNLISEASAGDLAAVRTRLEGGADVDGTDSYGNTALMWASWMGRDEVIQLLLAKGALANLEDKPASDTALTKAAFNGKHGAVKLLLSAGAKLDHQNKYGITALMNAAMQGHRSVVDALIRAGADVRARDQGGVTALHKAASKSHDAVIRSLLAAGADVDAKRTDGVTPIMMAQPNSGTFNLLKANGAEIPQMHRQEM